jgi:DNA polymerase III sliding clamp (beta) subunit (PCNA family)
MRIDFDECLACCIDNASNKRVNVSYDMAVTSDENNTVNELAFNLDFLLEALKSFDDTLTIAFSGNGALSPWLLTQGNHTHLLMPIQVK